jgi:hypothetical protein
MLLKVTNIIEELEGPPLIRYLMLLTRDQIEAKLGVLSITWGTKFDDITNFPKDEI